MTERRTRRTMREGNWREKRSEDRYCKDYLSPDCFVFTESREVAELWREDREKLDGSKDRGDCKELESISSKTSEENLSS